MTKLDIIANALPLTVRGIEVTDPILTLFGDQWSLNLMCDWRFSGNVSLSWESDDIEDGSWDLIGRSIVAESATSSAAVDPTFEFDDGTLLQVHADTDLDPWTLTLPGIVVTGTRA